MNSLLVEPISEPISAASHVPGSKSITNRAMLLALLSKSKVKLENPLFSDDTRVMIDCLDKLGLEVSFNEDQSWVEVQGCGVDIPNRSADLFVGNAGTVARFLTAALALRGDGCYRLDGTEAMRKRPMAGLLDVLTKLGVEFVFEEEAGHFPFVMQTTGLKGGIWEVDASASSQLLSALLMIAPCIKEPVIVKMKGGTVSWPFVEMTCLMMNQFGYARTLTLDEGRNEFVVEPVGYKTSFSTYAVEPDMTAASYFQTLPLVLGGEVLIEGLSESMTLQGDRDYMEIVKKTGGELSFQENGLQIMVEKGKVLKGGAYDFNSISDTFLTLAAISPLLDGVTKIVGIKHTRKQETDRVHAMATELKKLGQKVIETEDALEITPDLEGLKKVAEQGVSIETYDDHRVAMSFALLGSYDLLDGKPWMTILDPLCCRKTFPNYFEELNQSTKKK